jgi:hypothetical protein
MEIFCSDLWVFEAVKFIYLLDAVSLPVYVFFETIYVLTAVFAPPDWQDKGGVDGQFPPLS